MWLTLIFCHIWCCCTAVLKYPLKLLKCVRPFAPSVSGPRLLSCFSLSSCPLFYTISVSPLSVFFLVVSCSVTLLSACKSVSALHSGLCQHLELSHLWNKAVLEDQTTKLIKIVCKVRVNNLWVWFSCAVLWGCTWVFVHEFCDIYWSVSQLSICEMSVACTPIVFSCFEFPWIMIILLESPHYLWFYLLYHSLVLTKYFLCVT